LSPSSKKYLLDFLAILESVYLKAIAKPQIPGGMYKWRAHKVQSSGLMATRATVSSPKKVVHEGDKVEFEVTDGKKGKQASAVTVLNR
jgi:hypothetical protein